MKRFILGLAGTLLAVSGFSTQAADLAAGKATFNRLNCASCHGADGKTSMDPAYPVLAGQHQDYLSHALHAYRRGQEGADASANTRKNPIMGAFATQLSEEDIANVTAYLASLPSDLGVRK
jgi:cytochrome c553